MCSLSSELVLPHDPEIRGLVEQACVEFEREIRAFLLGVLKDVHLADDAFQKTVLNALRAANSVSSGTVRGWLFTIALNEAREIRRVSKRQARLHKAVWECSLDSGRLSADDGQDNPESVATRREETEAVLSALERLDENYRDVVLRRIQHGQTFVEIAADLKRPLGTVLTWMRRALLELREMDELKSLSRDEK